MEEAIELYTRAVDLSDEPYEQALFWRAIGEAQALRDDTTRAGIRMFGLDDARQLGRVEQTCQRLAGRAACVRVPLATFVHDAQ